MTVNKNSGRNPMNDLSATDAAVSLHLGGGDAAITSSLEQIARRRQMTPSQRKKAARDAARTKVTYDFPAELIEQVDTLAREAYRCPASHLAALLVKVGLQAVSSGQVNVYDYRVPARSLRFDYSLDLNAFDENAKWKD